MSRLLSTTILKKILEPKGYHFEDIRLGETKARFIRITLPAGSQLMISASNPMFPFSTSAAILIYRDKLKSYDLVRQLGIEVPKTYGIQQDLFSEEKQAIAAFLAAEKHVIVKPFNRSGSRGLTLDITTKAQLDAALRKAFNESPTALIQTQFIGEEVRFGVVNGVVRAALLRKKPTITGDGSSTIEQLIQQENNERKNLVNPLVDYPQLDDSLVSRDLLQSKRITSKDEVVELNKNTMISGGASIYNILTDVHPGYIALAEKIAQQFGSGFLAIDFMMSDYTQAPDESNYVFLEININPALSLFGSCRDGNQSKIVEDYLVPLIEKSIAIN